MAKTVLVALIALFLWPSSGLAQTSATRQWDTAFTLGLFNARPSEAQPLDYGDDWFHTADYRASVGRLWNEHLKTELEFGTTGQGSRYVTRFEAGTISSGAREFYHMHQGTAKLTWQFLDNSWVQPYLSAGVMVEGEEKHTHVFERYVQPDPRTGTPRIIAPAYDEPSHTTYRPGVSLSAGAKFYVSPQAFFKAGAQSTWTYHQDARSSSSVSFLAGFGFDF